MSRKKLTDEEIAFFNDLVDCRRMTIPRAAREMQEHGYPSRSEDFWRAERRKFQSEMRQFMRDIASEQTADDDFIGHRD